MMLFSKPDIHSHDVSRADTAIINISPGDAMLPGVVYSCGIHPWNTDKVDDHVIADLEQVCMNPQVVAIGETGLDALRGAGLDVQMSVLRKHIELSESLSKPLILHIVKTFPAIISLRKTLRPAMPWIIHGFRGKPQLTGELLRHGFYLSLGENFNQASAKIIPQDKLLYESDTSPLPIPEIISRISIARNV